MIMGEIGYLQPDDNQASPLSSKIAFGELGDVFAGDAVMAGAAHDRLLHRSTVLNINGDSYRMMEKKKADVKLIEEVKKAPKG